jgi:hypothetical protein
VPAVRVAAALHATGHGHAAGAARGTVRRDRVADELAVDLEREVGAAVVDVLGSVSINGKGMGWRGTHAAGAEDFAFNVGDPVVLGDEFAALDGRDDLGGAALGDVEPDRLLYVKHDLHHHPQNIP